MATIRRRPSGAFEVVIRSKLLHRPYYATLDSEGEAREYAARLEAMLASGMVPPELLDGAGRATVGELVGRYRRGARVSSHDLEVLGRLPDSVLGFDADKLTVPWALAWVVALQDGGIAPGTIRKKVGALARCLDWCVLAGFVAANPLRSLPRNYAAYPSEHGARREDVERDRRLAPGEEDAVRAVLAGRPEWDLLFTLALETAMRMRELFTLDWRQVDLDRRTVFLDKTKNGDKRQVPLSSVAVARLAALHKDSGLLFPWWDGRAESLRNTTCRISHQWARIARDAGCDDLHFHDLRHEATCRLFERTTMTDVMISRITGHRSLSMLRRYASLRGSDLAVGLW